MMISIESYMNDGANWQAQAVLACLRNWREDVLDVVWNGERYDAEIYVGRYENYNEQGYVISLVYDHVFQRNYVVYEYRNSDDLCAFAYDEKTINTPTLSEIAEKYHAATKSGLGNYIKTFPFFHIEECVNYIKEDMIEWLSKQKK